MAARGGTCGGGLELCCPSGTRFPVVVNMLVWKGFPRAVCEAQDPFVPLVTGALFHVDRLWVALEVPKTPADVVPQAGTGEVEKTDA